MTDAPAANPDINKLQHELMRLNAVIRSVENQRNEALTARAKVEATLELVVDELRKAQARIKRLEDVKALAAEPAPQASNGIAPPPAE